MEWVRAWKGDGMNRDLFAAGGGVDATTDPYFNSTTLLLSGDGTNGAQNNTFVDSSANNATITRAGTPTQGSFSPFSQTGWSGYFDGTGNYLYATNSVFNPGATGAWTLECFVYPLGNGTFYSVGNGAPSGSNMMSTYYNGSFGFAQQNGSSYVVTINSASSYTAIQWYHYAVSKDSSNVIRLFINGIQVGTQTYSSALTDGTTAVINGRYDNNGLGNTGATVYLSQLRWMKGTSLYTTTPFAPPTAPLTAITGTSLLTLQDNRFKDNSTNNFTITAVGTPSVQAFSPFAPTAAYSLPAAAAGSAYFNGSSYISVPDSTAFTMGAGDFTLEAWVYLTTSGTSRMIFGTCDAAGSQGSMSYVLSINASNNAFFAVGYGGSMYGSTNTATVPTNQWVHIAGVRSGANVYVYLNGMQSTSNTNMGALAITDSTQVVAIGRNGAGNFEYLTGYISNARITKGTAVYTGNFTPSGTPLSKIQSAGTNIAALSGTETSLLTLQDSTFKDNSVNVATITASSPAPVIQSFTPFTQVWGGLFDGSSSLSVPASTNWQFGTGDFAVEFWIKTAGANCQLLSLVGGTAAGNWQVSIYNGSIYWQSARNTTDTLITSSTPISNNAWHHVSYVRSNVSGTQTLKVYFDGVQQNSVADATNYNVSSILNIGYSTSYFTGYLSNVRIVKGTAVYTGAFTPPAKTLSATQAAGTNISAITGTATSLLTLQDPTFKDNATLPNTITAAGTLKAQLVSAPFTSAATVDPVNGSGYFDGSSYLTIPSNTGFQFPTGTDFTVECWVNFNSVSGGTSQQILSPWGGNSGWQLYWQGANKKFTWYANASSLITGTMVPVANTWYHVAISRQNGVIKSFVNGILDYSVADTANYAQTSPLYIGVETASTGYFSGYISNVRIVKGTAVYTTTSTTVGTVIFTPPIAPLIAITNTSLLTLQDTTFKDNSTNALAITAAGSPSMRAFTPFASNWGGYFDGSSYISAPKNTALEPAISGAWTIEFLCYTTSTSSQSPWTYGNATISSGPDLGTYFNVIGNSAVQAGFYSSTQPTTISGGTLTLNQWHHLALVSDGTMMTLYLNGLSVGTPVNISGAAINAPSSATGRIGQYNSGSPQYFNGYISNFRFVKGTAVYTTNFQPPSAPLTAITNTSLLTLQNNTFIDNSTNALAITTVGAPKTQLLQLPFTSSITKVAAPWNISVTAPLATVGGSMYFTGSSTTADKIAVTSSVALGFGTGAYTIEYWYNPSIAYSGGPEGYSFDMGSTGNGTRIDTFSNSVRFYYNNGATALIATAGVGIQPGAWYHLAIVRTVSSDITIYINGVACGTVNSAANETSTYISIGGYGGPTYNIWGYTGYISNFRVVKGTAVYTGAFTPPAAPPQPTQTPGLLGTNVNAIDGTNTSLLLLGSNAGIYDATAKNDIITVGNAQVSSTQIKYGTGAMYFDGTGDWLQSPSSSQTLAFATGDFTVECWVNFATNNGTYNPFVRYDGSGTFDFGYDYSVAQIKYNGSGAIFAISQTFTVGTWYHVALTRASGSSRLFVNGTQVGSTATGDTNNYASGAFKVGGSSYSGSHVMSGYIDDLRITKAARYTVNFTPPTKAMIGQ